MSASDKPAIRGPAIQALLQHATNLQQRGQLTEAEAICTEILRVQTDHAATLRLLGTIRVQGRDWAGAAQIVGRLILADPHNAQTHSDHGTILKLLNQWDSALASYEEAVRLDPNLAEAHCGRADILFALRRYQDAIAAYDRAIVAKPDHAKAYYNRGVVLGELEQRQDALASYRQAVRIKPAYSLAHGNCGVLLEQLGQLDAALESYDRAIEADPRDARALSNRGNLLRKLDRMDAALESCDRAIAIMPNLAQAHYNRSAVLWDLDRSTEALDACNQAISLHPGFVEAYSLRGNLLREFTRWDEALASFSSALSIQPQYADAYCNRGAVLSQLRRIDEALKDYDKAIELTPDHVPAHWNRAYALLLQGDFARGWIEHEWRRRHEHLQIHDTRDSPAPLWLGEDPIAGKKILLHSEQGLGDTIQFCRYATLLANLGAVVILRVQSPLLSLLSNLDGVTQVLGESEQSPVCDMQCPLMSLPLAFKTTLDTVPSHVPYLRPDAQKVAFWKRTLGPKRIIRVGLVWSGGVTASRTVDRSRNRRRNIPLVKLMPLMQCGVEFYSLQKGEPAVSELSALKIQHRDAPNIIDFTHLLHDFSDTAALIENLDLVISVDTSTAHLAGALGKPVWILNRFDTCWRWLLDRVDSPWYPTLKLYRQRREGDWDNIISQVANDLCRIRARTDL